MLTLPDDPGDIFENTEREARSERLAEAAARHSQHAPVGERAPEAPQPVIWTQDGDVWKATQGLWELEVIRFRRGEAERFLPRSGRRFVEHKAAFRWRHEVELGSLEAAQRLLERMTR